ncbi:uncharacterized protein BDZ99DRAFT_571203 [Mytilinidion resinicola]|uniref:DUF7709 domain-containing protein n=1 Tax=Mytilinidion resinicola TaxID=574789 RepID=A0A6A6YMY4_9PEZI|nr:uncharacterized protein BDZ99DRAFT_571203 [Mytilinidion resinicola]KAF2809364.1 hypothetical protein BDZ99DRAFT_571203 [Mytilinidion resinicola]
MSSSNEVASLASSNSKTLGASFPVITLPSGIKVPTGTVDSNKTKEDEEELKGLAEQMKAALPVLKKVGMFDLFTPDEWVQGKSPGRKLVGEEAKKLEL